MERRLRTQLTASVFGALVVLLTVIIAVTQTVRWGQLNETADSYLEVIVENGGTFPEDAVLPDDDDEDAEAPYESRYFSAVVNEDGVPLSLDLDNVASIDETQAALYVLQAVSGKANSGYVGTYRYLVADRDDGTRLVVFLDRSREITLLRSSLTIETLASLGGALAVTAAFALMSRRIVRPIVAAQRSQRQFIVDAGHDLRTPISIISADAAVLEMDVGENEWVDDIKRQTAAMSELTESLIVLSRVTSDDAKREGEQVSLSDVVSAGVAGFQSRSRLEGHDITAEVEPGVMVRGTEQYLSRMVGALLDNAFKYSVEGGDVTLALRRHLRQAELTVSNRTKDVDPDEVSRWFDRFYQSDRSRTHRAGGYGIGLAMVRAVAESHGGRASAQASPDGTMVTFTVTLPTIKGEKAADGMDVRGADA